MGGGRPLLLVTVIFLWHQLQRGHCLPTNQSCQPLIDAFDRPHPYTGTVLESVVAFRWKPKKPRWQYPKDPYRQALIEAPPPVFNMFDVVLWPCDTASFTITYNRPRPAGNPRSVLAYASHSVKKAIFSLQLTQLLPNQKRALVLAGEDTKLGGDFQSYIHHSLINYFSHIWFEAKDRKDSIVKTVPMGLTPFYLVNANVTNVTRVLEEGRNDPMKNSKLVLAAWGSVNGQLDRSINHRISLIKFLKLNSTKQWLQRSYLSMTEYWKELIVHKFSICPPGNGVQAPKIAEALMAHAIPITLSLPAFVDIKKLGYPILLVEKWGDLSASYLEREYETTFTGINWTRVNEMLHPHYIYQLVTNSTWQET